MAGPPEIPTPRSFAKLSDNDKGVVMEELRRQHVKNISLIDQLGNENTRLKHKHGFVPATEVNGLKHAKGLLSADEVPSCHEYHVEERKVIEKLRGDIAGHERDVYEYKLSNKRMRKQLEDSEESHRGEMSQLRKDLTADFEKKLKELREQHNRAEAQWGADKEELVQARDFHIKRYDDLYASMGGTRGEITNLKAIIVERDKTIETLKGEVSGVTRRLRELEQENITLGAKHTEVTRQNHTLQAKIMAVEQEYHEMMRDKDNQLSVLNGLISDLRAKLAELESNHAALLKKIQNTENSKTASAMANQANIKLIEDLQKTIKKLKAEQHTYQEEIRALQTNFETVRNENQILLAQIKLLREELEKKQAGAMREPPAKPPLTRANSDKSKFQEYVELKREIARLQETNGKLQAELIRCVEAWRAGQGPPK